jgi:hypothetical protein
LIFLLKRVCTFITRNRARIITVIGEENAGKLDAVMTACDALTLVIFPLLEPGD